MERQAQRNSTGALAWIVWSLAALFVVFNYVQQVVPNVISADLERAFAASGATLGVIAASYFYAYACMQIPVGMIVDRFGTRRPLVLAIAAAGLGTLAFAGAHGSGPAQAARLIMGAGSAFSFIACLKLVEEWFPPGKFSTLAGLTNTAGMLGAASGAPVAMLVKSIGWRGSIVWLAGAELALAVLVFFIVKDSAGSPRAPEPAQQHAGAGGIGSVVRNPQAWLNAIYATSISLVFVAFGGLWGQGYIEKVYGMDSVGAAAVGSLLFIGGIAGSLFFGWFSDFLNRRKPPMVLAGVGALATMAALIYVPHLPLPAFRAGLFTVGFFSSANIVSYAVARDLCPRVAGVSIGFLSTCFYAGSASSQPLVGMLLGRKSPGGLAEASPEVYRYAFSPLVFFMLVGLAVSLMMRETISGAEAAASAEAEAA